MYIQTLTHKHVDTNRLAALVKFFSSISNKPKPAAPLVVPVVVVADPEPKSIMKRTEVRQTRPKAPAIVKQDVRVEEQAVEDADDCCGCPKRTCAILWFVLFLLALAGLITMLVLYFLK